MKNNNFCMPPYLSNDDHLTISTYQEIFYRLERNALNCVRWNTLPDYISQMIIEKYLFYRGNGVFFFDPILERYLVLPISGEFAWDIDGYPIEYDVIGWNGYRVRLNIENSVIIWNNYQNNPSVGMVGLLASRLTNTLRTGDMHLELQKLGKIISVPESKQRGVKALIQRIKNFHVYTIGSPALKDLGESTQVLDTELDYIVDKLDAHYTFLWHDALNYFGIDSMSNKISGVGAGEVKAEATMAKSNREAIMNPRKDAVKKINEMFGLNISVEFVGGDESVQLYNDIERGNGSVGQPDDTNNT